MGKKLGLNLFLDTKTICKSICDLDKIKTSLIDLLDKVNKLQFDF